MSEFASGPQVAVPANLRRTLARGARGVCPACGNGRLFEGVYRLRAACAACGLDYDRLAHDTWALIYVSTAALTGVVIVAVVFFRPFDVVAGRFLLAIGAALLIVATLPLRKGLAIGLNHYLDTRMGTGERER